MDEEKGKGREGEREGSKSVRGKGEKGKGEGRENLGGPAPNIFS